MDVLAEIQRRMRPTAEVTFAETSYGIRIGTLSADGFAVTIDSNLSGECPPEWTVYIGECGYHTHILDPKEAVEFVTMCFSGEWRLREIRRGELTVRAFIEARSPDGWRREGSYGLLFSPFWRSKSEHIFLNANCLME
jgi:hypothetical protein